MLYILTVFGGVVWAARKGMLSALENAINEKFEQSKS